MLQDRVRLPGQQRLVQLESVRRAHDTVGGNLVPRTQLEEIVEHDLLHRDLAYGAIPHDPRDGRVQHGEPVEGALGPVLLHDADERVDHEHDPEQPVRG